MKDSILRATAADGFLRVFVANTKQTVQEAFDRHKTSPVMSAALGRLLTGGAMMGYMLKNDTDMLTVTIKGDGPGQGLSVTADSHGNVKGYCYEPMVDLPLKPNGKLDVQAALGYGTLTVIKDMGLKEPYVGQIPLISGEIAEDLTYYFVQSEQTPSAVALGVLVDRDYSIRQSGGFILQLMPGAPDELVDFLENKLANISPVTELLESGMTNEDILKELCEKYEYTINDTLPVHFKCNCSKDRVKKALIAIGKEELKKITEEDKKATLHCHFCNTDYHFTEEELKEILKTAEN